MTKDPIVEEIHRIREQIAAQSNDDLAEICRAARDHQAASGIAPAALPPRRVEPNAPDAKKAG